MIIYTNAELNFEVEDADNSTITYDEYIYSSHGIFKKYKFHYFACDVNEDVQTYLLGKQEFLVQQALPQLNKQKILTSIPYQNFYVKRKTITCSLNEHLTLVKEIDNDTFSRHYFMISNGTIYDGFDHISSYLNKKV